MHLRRRLPEYAVPSMLLPIDALPLTLTGKVDRAQLPPVPCVVQSSALSPPRNPTEKAIADIWCEVLGLDAAGRDQNFFDLGGHSLLLARVQSLLMSALGRSVAMADMFAFPTVAALAAALDGGAATSDEFQVNRARALNRREMLRKRRTEEVQPND
jgi:acyl carrier protein